MKESIKERGKKCPICKKEYPEEDIYCGDDGSALELVPAIVKHRSQSERRTDDVVTAERNGV
jgi:hypothetical protein